MRTCILYVVRPPLCRRAHSVAVRRLALIAVRVGTNQFCLSSTDARHLLRHAHSHACNCGETLLCSDNNTYEQMFWMFCSW